MLIHEIQEIKRFNINTFVGNLITFMYVSANKT